jgi:hypothetical protein
MVAERILLPTVKQKGKKRQKMVFFESYSVTLKNSPEIIVVKNAKRWNFVPIFASLLFSNWLGGRV